jgi:hypothetical protein
MNELRQIVHDASNGMVVAGSTKVNDDSFMTLQKSIEMQEKKLHDLSLQVGLFNVRVPEVQSTSNYFSNILCS